MRYHAKIDRNQKEIVEALREAGCAVQSLATLGHGVPDLLVSRNGQMWLIEVKDGTAIPSKQKLTEDQILWKGRWKAPVHVVRSRFDALLIVGDRK